MDKINCLQIGGHYIHILFYTEFNLKRAKIEYSIKQSWDLVAHFEPISKSTPTVPILLIFY